MISYFLFSRAQGVWKKLRYPVRVSRTRLGDRTILGIEMNRTLFKASDKWSSDVQRSIAHDNGALPVVLVVQIATVASQP